MNDENQSEDLFALIETALRIHETLDEDRNYAPIFNSGVMLIDLQEHVNDEGYLKDNEDELNVGLLAEKALDFDEDFREYAASLHRVWYAVLLKIKSPFLQIVSKHQDVYNFYKTHFKGYKDLHETIVNHMKGIDFNSSYDVDYIIKDPKIVVQWMAKNIPQGNYYADDLPHVKPNCLGIYKRQVDKNTGVVARRKKRKYKVNGEITVLKSQAAGVLDTWSMPKSILKTGYWLDGGCDQYFNVLNKAEFV